MICARDNVCWGLVRAVLLLFASGCNSQGDIFEELDSSEHEWSKRMSSGMLLNMTVDSLYPDRNVRALAEAAGSGNIATIDELLDSGIDVNARGAKNVTALFWAMKNIDGFTRLLERGADPNIVFDGGSSVMYWSVQLSDARFLERLLAAGGNPNIPYGQFDTPLIFEAVAPETKSKLPILLSAGADMNARRSNGNSLLMAATSLGQFDVVYDLLTRGADYTLKNRNGKTLVDYLAFIRSTLDPTADSIEWMNRTIEFLESRGTLVPTM